MSREMKDSGIEWVGNIPSDWEMLRVKNLFSTHKDIVGAQVDNFERLALTLGGVVKRSKTDSDGLQPEGFNNYQILRKGELVFKLIDLENVATSRVGLSPYTGIVSPAYIVATPNGNVNVRYAEHYFRSMWKREIFNHLGDDGVRSSLNSRDLGDIPFCAPPLYEQEKIASFLDFQCSQIDSVAEHTRSSIDEYKKLKQAVITKAVTEGIHGERPMKDSGVEWIGVFPTDWSITALKYCATLQAGITLGKKYPKGTELIEVPYLRVANVQGDHVDISDVATIQVTAEEIEKYALHDGELLMTEGGDRDKLGRGTVWHGEIVPCIHQNHVFAVETDESKLLVRFFDYVTSAASARTYFDLTAKKTTNLACTNSTTILRYRFALPPIAEQQEIVEYLDSKCVELDALIAKKEQYLVELENYKKSLIYEYVTGKKEVR